MAIKRIVSTEFWTDPKVIEMFSPEDKLFFLYLMTNPHTTQLGVYQISKRVMSFELGYSLEAVTVLIDRFENKYGLIKYSAETSEVAIKNYLKHSIVKGGKPVEDLLAKEISEVKDHSLLEYVHDSLSDVDNLNVSVCKILPLLKENDNDNDNDNDDSLPCKVTNRGNASKEVYEELKDEVLLGKETAEKVCEWCGCKTSVLHKHHYPIPKRLGGTQIVNICSNCHAEFHSIEAKEFGGTDSLYEVESSKRRNFKPPTVQDVKAYCIERGNEVDPERFIDFYESKGWMVGKNKMKDWKAAVRNWERKENADKLHKDRFGYIDEWEKK